MFDVLEVVSWSGRRGGESTLCAGGLGAEGVGVECVGREAHGDEGERAVG